MSSTYQVDTARIAGAAGDIQRIATSIQSDVRTMMTRLHALQDCWRGAAAGNFANVTQDWGATQEKVRSSLENISQALRVAGEDYAMVEQANVTRFTPK